MSELPVPAETTLPTPEDRRDSWTRYRTFLGKLHTLVDRRVFWASAERELIGYEDLRKGERSARRTFWRLTRRGMSASDAIREAIGLGAGAIPEFQDQAKFDAYWTVDRVKEIGDRWAASKLTQRCAAVPVRTAVSKLEDAAPDLADTLITIARNPMAKDADRRQAARDGLVMLGVKLEHPTQPDVSPFLLTGNETPDQLENMLLQVAQKEPDPNRARLMTETIRAMLKAKKPEVWGDKLEVNSTGPIGIGAIVVEMQRVRDASLEAARDRAEAIETTATPALPEGRDE